MKTKMQLATEFLLKFSQMDQDDLQQMVDLEAGRDLAQLLAMFAATTVKRGKLDPEGCAATCIVIGYMIRAFEDRQTLYLPPKK